MQQFQVPQFIEVEDKVVGPFSLKQFIFVGLGGGLILLLYFIMGLTMSWFILAIILAGVGLSLALAKVNGISLTKVVGAAALYLWDPQLYVWQPLTKTVKTAEAVRKLGVSRGIDLEKILTGITLHAAWQKVQTSTKKDPEEPEESDISPQKIRPPSSTYQIFTAVSGERKAAKRIDY